MNMMTANTQKHETILVNVRNVGEFGNRFKVNVSIPAQFDIEDDSSTKIYYTSWNNERNLPKEHPLHNCIEEIKEVVRLHEMQLISRSDIKYVSFVGETHTKISLIKSQLMAVFNTLGYSISFDI